jgi:hypothetical protein
LIYGVSSTIRQLVARWRRVASWGCSMTKAEFDHAMNVASRYDAPCYLLHRDREVIAIGVDGERDVVILTSDEEVPLRELSEPLV